MLFRDVCKYFHEAHKAVKESSPEKLDRRISELYNRFYDHREQQFRHPLLPSFVCEQAIQLVRRYLDDALPALEYYEQEDRQDIARYYREFIGHLEASAAISQKAECAFEQLIEQLRNRTFSRAHEVAEAFLEILQTLFGIESFLEVPALHSSQEPLTTLRENFRYDQAAEFFRNFLDALLRDSITLAASKSRLPGCNFTRLFEFVLEGYFQGKAVLVDKTRQGHILPLWVTVDCEKTGEHVEFWHQDIDANMQASADIARRVARQYLSAEYGKNVPENVFVQCLFPHLDVNLKDTSASLLIGIRIVAEVLGLKSKPATVVTGEVGENGDVRGVGFIHEKIEASHTHEKIARILIPAENVQEMRDIPISLHREAGQDGESSTTPFSSPVFRIIAVRTFAEAVQQVLDLHREDWDGAYELDTFYGREKELGKLQEWIFSDHCRLAAVLGMGGVGKTTLTRKFADQIKNRFQYLFWRDLRNAPSANDILEECVKFLSNQQEVELSDEIDKRITLLLKYLRKYRCLVVLDGLEAILQGGAESLAGCFRSGYEDYGALIQQVGGIDHQSCVILTSREKPKQIVPMEGKRVRSLPLHGLKPIDAEKLLTGLQGTARERHTLAARYGCHPLALKLVAATIHNVFHRHIGAFLAEETRFIGIEALLQEQYKRLSSREQEVMYWLAIAREAASIAALRNDIVNPLFRRNLPEIMDSLQRKSLIEQVSDGFTLQPVVMEYMTERVIDQVCEELSTGKISLFNSNTLMKAQAKDHSRESQKRLIFTPMVEKLLYEYELDEQHIEAKLREILAARQKEHVRKPGYAGGNALNLLVHLKGNLCNYDFSDLIVWQAYLQGIDVHDVDFTHADLSGAVFTETFGAVLSVAFSPDGEFLAAGTSSNEIRIWQAESGRQLLKYEGHEGWVWSIAFTSDGKTLASGSIDNTVRLWDVAAGRCLRILRGHTGWVWSVTFSPDDNLLARGCGDGTVRIWDVQTGRTLKILQAFTLGVHAVVFSPDGKTLVSSGGDKIIQLWKTPMSDVLNADTVHALGIQCALSGHTGLVRSVVFSPDGRFLVSGSDDKTVRVWQFSTGQCLDTLSEHTAQVKSVAFSPDGHTLASGSEDENIRLWDIQTGDCLKTLAGHTCPVRSVAFHPDGHTLASGSEDKTVRLWNVKAGKCIGILNEHTNWVRSVVFSPDGHKIASASEDGAIRLWDVRTGKCLHILQPDRPYERMNITGGITDIQKATLRALGAVED